MAADFYMSLYNVIFTVLPPLIIGMFDQDVDREMSRLYPGANSALLTAHGCTVLLHAGLKIKKS